MQVFLLDGLLSALPDPAAGTAALDSSDCSYYSCDHSSDYVGTASNGADDKLTTDGVIYPKYTPFSGAAEPGTTQLWGLEIDHTGDYVGTPPEPLTGDGVIYPAYDPSYAEAPGSTTQLWGLEQDHTGDYIGSDGSLLGDGVIYPAQEGAAPGTTMSLYQGADHSGAYYCTEPEADCSVDVVDPVLKPIEYPLGVTMALAAPPMAAAPVPKKGDKDAPAKPGPGHMMLMGPALIFGAAEATAKLFSSEKGSGSWIGDFKAESCKAADAVTPVGGFFLKKGMAE